MSRIPVPNGGLQHSPGSPGMPSTPASEPRRKTNRRDEVSPSFTPQAAPFPSLLLTFPPLPLLHHLEYSLGCVLQDCVSQQQL